MNKIDFEYYSPQELRDQIELELQRCGDPIKASYNAIAFLNNLYGVTSMSKASQLQTGAKIESEHKETIQFIDSYFKKHGKIPSAKEIEKHIAKNHIDENPDYYTRLLAMEDQAKGDKKRPKMEIDVIKFLIKNPYPSDAKVHSFADSLGINTHKLEAIFYRLATERATMSKDMFKGKNISEMFKARITKYIKRIPKPSGKGYIYFYTQDEVNAYQKNGTLPGEPAKKGNWLSSFMGFFGFKEKKQAEDKVKEDYKTGEVKEKFGLSLSDWSKHIAEYFGNKSKWDALFLKKLEAQTKVKTTTGTEKKKAIGSETKIATTISGAVKKAGFNLKAMYFIFNYYKQEKKQDESISDNTKNGTELPSGAVSAVESQVHSGRTQGTTLTNVPETKPTDNRSNDVLGSVNTGIGSGRDVRLTLGQLKAQRAQILALLASKTNEEMTEEDKAVLRSYEGGGGTKEDGLTDAEIQYAFYTPRNVVSKVWQLANKYVSGPLSVLEPSAGSGRFAEDQPADRKFTMFELDPTSARINSILHPEAEIIQDRFETNFMKGGLSVGKNYKGKKFNITVGNPPYGEYSGFYKGRDEGKDHTRFEEYFMDRALDTLEDGGIMAYVVPSAFLRKGNNKIKEAIAGKGRLLEAYRLPNGTFSTTKVGTDILIIRKEKGNVDDFNSDQYFDKNPEKILGDITLKPNRFGKKDKNGNVEMEQFVALRPGETFDSVLNNIDPSAVAVVPYNKPDMSEEAKHNIAMGLMGNDNAKKGIKATPKKESAIAGDPIFSKPSEEKAFTTTSGTGSEVETNESFNAKYNKDINPEEMNIWLKTKWDGTIDKEGLSVKDRKYLLDSDNICVENGQYVHRVNYASGDIFQKLEKLEEQKEDMPERKYLNQKSILESTKPIWKTVKNFTISPITEFAKEFKFTSEDDPEGISLNERFLDWAIGSKYHYNMDWQGGVTKHDIPSGISWSDIMDYIKQKGVSKDKGSDSGAEARKFKTQELRRNIAEKLYKRFIEEGLNPSEEAELEKVWNERFNSHVDPDYTKIPISLNGLSTTFKGQPLVINETQLKALSMSANKGNALLALDTGVGKTLSGILATVNQLQTGKCKKPVICVPKAVYTNWLKEIKDLFPDLKINELGNLGSEFVSKNLKIEEGTLSIMTYQALQKIGFKDETINDKLMNDMLDSQQWDKEEMTPLERAEMRNKILEKLGSATKTKTAIVSDNGSSEPIFIENLKIVQKSGIKTYNGRDIEVDRIKSAFKAHGETFIVVKTNSSWDILEVKTGLQLATGGNQKSAMEDATKKISQRTEEEFKKMISNSKIVNPDVENNFETMPENKPKPNIQRQTNVGGNEGDAVSVDEDEDGDFEGDSHFIEDLGFDHITVDEAHHFKNIFSAPKPTVTYGPSGKPQQTANEFDGLSGGSSAQGMKMFAMTQLIQQENNDRNVLLLTATPFTNSPLEIYNILSLVARKRLKELHIYNLHEFMANFAKLKSEWAVKMNGKIEKKMVMKEFQNLSALQSLIQEYIMKVDGAEAGIIIPKEITHQVPLNMTPLQKRIMEIETKRFDIKETPAGEKYQGAALIAINNMRMAGVSPKMLELEKDPVSKKLYEGTGILEELAKSNFVDSSPKLTFSCGLTKQVYESRPDLGQILYVSRGVDYYNEIIDNLVSQGVPRDAIATLSGNTSSTKPKKPTAKNPEMLSKKDMIMREFNDPNGKIKIIIGSESIMEGVNMNGNTAVGQDLLLDWNPSGLKQFTGRYVRQGNKQGIVHTIFPQLIDSVDSAMYQKLDEKSKRIGELFSYKGLDNLNVESINPEELKFDLIKDPVRRAQYDMEMALESLDDKKRNERIYIDTLNMFQKQHDKYTQELDYAKKSTAEYKEDIVTAEAEEKEATQALKDYKAKADKKNSYYEQEVMSLERRERYKKDNAIGARKDLKKNATEINLLEKSIQGIESKLNNMAVSMADISQKIAEKEKIIADIFEQEVDIKNHKEVYIEKAEREIKENQKFAPSTPEVIKAFSDLVLGNLKAQDQILNEMAKAIKIFYRKNFNPSTAEFEYAKIIARV